MIGVADRRGDAPAITRRCAADFDERPRRLHRTRKRSLATPPGAVYVGRPTVWGNPFSGRPRIGHARSVILYRSWLADRLTERMLRAAGFGRHEIETLARWRLRLIALIPKLAGRDLQCWCPLTSDWCHADVLLAIANSATEARG